MQRKILLIAVTMAVFMAAVVQIPASDAEDGQDDTYYCYGDHPKLMPKYDVDSEWEAVSEDGTEVTPKPNSDGSVTIDLTGHNVVYVTQTVGNEVVKAKLIALHLGEGTIVVNFHDRGSVISTYEITGDTVVKEGDLFVITPEDPARDGYEFGGWYTDSSFVANSAFDPRDVVTSDMDVYARWTPVNVPSGGDSGHISTGVHTVTFQCDEGLTYDVISNSNGTVSFTVSEQNGYDVIWSTVGVDADTHNVTYANGVYTISGISSDVIVSITGEFATSDNPEDPVPAGNDYTMFAVILIVLAVICIVLAIYILRTRRSRV